MRALFGFMRRERLYILLLAFVAILTAITFMPYESGRKEPPASAAGPDARAARPDIALKQEALQEILSKDAYLALVFGLVSLLFIAVLLLGIVIDILIVSSRLAGGGIEISTHALKTVPWGMWDVCRVVILFLFFGYIILLIETFLAPIWPFIRSTNVRMILNSSALDAMSVFFILYFTVGQYKEKLVSLGISFRNFAKNVWYGIAGYIAIVPVLVAVMLLTAFVTNLIKYVPEKQAVVELFLKEKNTHLLFYTSLFAAIAGPIVEELFFRAFMYNAVKKYIGIFWAMMVSAATFALLHAHAVGFFPILVLGMLLAYLYEKTGTIVSSVTVHMVHNLTMVGMIFLVKQIGVY